MIFDQINNLINALANLAWPIITLIIFFSLRGEILKIFPRIKKWKIFGNEIDVSDLSPLEIKEKEIREIREIENTSNIGDHDDVEEKSKNIANDYKSILTPENFSTLLPEIEKKAIEKIQKSLTFPIRRNIKIDGLQLDGFGFNKKDKLYFFEVKVFPNILDKNGGIKTTQVITRMNLWISDLLLPLRNFSEKYKHKHITLLFAIVLDTEKDLTDLQRKLQKIKNIYNEGQTNIVIKFQVLNLPKLEVNKVILSKN